MTGTFPPAPEPLPRRRLPSCRFRRGRPGLRPVGRVIAGVLLPVGLVLTAVSSQAVGLPAYAAVVPSQASGVLVGASADPGSVTDSSSPADEQAQQAVLDQLEQRIALAQDDVARARAELERAALVAGQALEVYSSAIRRLQAAQLEEQRQRDLLTQAQLTLATSRQLLGQWARQAYRDGTDVGQLGMITLLGARSTDDLGTTQQFLRRVGDSRSRTVNEVERALAVQADAADRAERAAEAAAAAAAQADEAKAAADAAVKQQRDTLARVEQVLAATSAAADEQRAQAQAAFDAALRLARAGGNSVTGQVGDCTGSGVENYSNGQIPLTALCPLAANGRHYLRADAAFAFDRLSRAYVARFGTPPCITDSYRSLAEQVRLYATKPQLAARPGTSNHGWGTALDLCGGIQSFTSDQHLWMLINAPLYGWFHPAWAQRGGSKPEPWHWEFSG